jgi:hypothetical protein
MQKSLNLVFSQPPEGVTDEEYNRWYDAHLVEILTVPGFVGAQRFRLSVMTDDPDAPSTFGYLAIFEIEGDLETVMAEMEAAGMSRSELYIEMKKTDTRGPALPSYWDRIRFASWNCTPLGERIASVS